MQKNSPFKKLKFSLSKVRPRRRRGKGGDAELNSFQTVTNSDREFATQLHKKLKNIENLIRADEFNFHKIEIFLIKISFSE